jgi:hypothetical protein
MTGSCKIFLGASPELEKNLTEERINATGGVRSSRFAHLLRKIRKARNVGKVDKVYRNKYYIPP